MLRMKRLSAIAALAIGSVLAAPASSQAGVLLQSVSSGCPDYALIQAFARWGDPSWYRLVPGGGFERDMPAWTLSKAKVVSGNEPFYVRSTRDSRSLSLPAGSVATSQTTCVGVLEPTVRFFARASSVSLTSRLSIQAVYEDSLGNMLTAPVGSVAATSTSWAPTPVFLMAVNFLALLPDQRTPVRFRFTTAGTATWTIDDVFVDPKRR